MDDIKLFDLVNVDALQRIQDGFSKYTGMASITTDANGVPITRGSGFTKFCMGLTRKSEEGCRNCEQCDKEGALLTLEKGHATVYECHAGLMDYAAPIIVDGIVFGSFVGGQVKTGELDEDLLERKAYDYGIDSTEYIKASREIKVLNKEDIEKAAVFLEEIASGLSEMAYRNYLALKESKQMEKIAKSQADFVMGMSMNLEHSMERWFKIIETRMNNTTDSDTYNLLSTMHNDSYEMQRNITDTIDYIRASASDIEINESKYKIETLKELILDGVSEIAEEKNVKALIDILKTDSDVLFGDIGRIGQMLNKSLRVILENKSNGTIEIALSTRKQQYATMLDVVFTDKNTIYTEEDMKKIREYFTRGDVDSYKTNNEIGMWLSLEGILLKSMSAKVSVDIVENDFIIKMTVPQLGL